MTHAKEQTSKLRAWWSGSDVVETLGQVSFCSSPESLA